MGKCIFILDEDWQDDKRVLSAMRELAPPAERIILDIREPLAISMPARLRIAWKSMSGFLRCMVQGWRSRHRISLVLEGNSGNPAHAGLLRAWRLFRVALAHSEQVKKMVQSHRVDAIYAADLYAAACLPPSLPGVHTIYDSHEFQIDRNRKKGLLRILFEYGLESEVLRQAGEVRAVNWKIARVMRDIHDLDKEIRVIHNNFYPPPAHPLPAPPPNAGLAVVYVGKGLRGRKLEYLNRNDLPFDVWVYALGEPLPTHLQNAPWHLGPKDYLEHLMQLCTRQRCLMWAASEVSCLSYRWALPNKFFQALALNIPIIAQAGTYLAEIVREHEIGLVLDDETTPQQIQQASDAATHARWRANMGRLDANRL